MQRSADPRTIIAQSAMAWRQVAIILLCVVLNGLDGFDVLSVSFASPGIAKAWGIERTALGVVLSMELIGMAFGSMALGQLADRIGSRKIALLCLGIMATGMFLAGHSASPFELGLVRLFTGLGIGGLLASISAIAAGSANADNKTTAVALMAAGYPLGAVLGGLVASRLLQTGEWRDVFALGAGLAALLLPLAWWLLPESFDSILHRTSGRQQLHEINRNLARLGHAPLDAAEVSAKIDPPGIGALLAPDLRPVTVLLIAAYFLHMLSFYFLLKWTPKIVADLGFGPAQAAGVLVWINIGGLAGSFLFSILTRRLALQNLVVASLAASAAFIAWFGLSAARISSLSLAAFAAGFSTNAVVVGLYALIAASYPAHLRAGGTGLVIGLGRGGAALGPIIGGLLFSAGFGRGGVAVTMAAGSAAAIIAVIRLYRLRVHAG